MSYRRNKYGKVQVTCGCGHEGSVGIYYSNSADWTEQIENVVAPEMCSECAQAAALKELKEEYNLPELTGTEKQIAWAEKLRKKFMASHGSLTWEEQQKHGYASELRVTKYAKVAYLATLETDSRWWIETRLSDTNEMAAYLEKKDLSPQEKKIADELRKEVLLVPPEANGNLLKIWTTAEYIYLDFPKDEDMKEIIKDMGYRWEDRWRRSTSALLMESPDDTICETAKHFYDEGYTIQFDKPENKQKILSGDYVELGKYIVSASLKGKVFKVKTPYSTRNKNDMKAMGGKWESPVWVLPFTRWEDVLDLGDNGYTLLEPARKLIQMAESLKAEIPVAGPKTQETEIVQKDEEGLINDLKD